MSLSDPYDDRLMADLAAAADGTLEPERQAEIEAMAAADPQLAEALERQRRAVSLLRGATAELRAPLALRERIEADRARLARAPRRRFRPRWLSAGVAGLAAAAAVVLALFVAAPGGPTVEDAAAFAVEPVSGPAPGGEGARLAVEQDGVAFPAWREAFGWRATGTRTGELDGRPATTVHYEKDGRTLAYTIVGGSALAGADRGTTLRPGGTAIQVFEVDGRLAATWERGGRTCILTGDGVDAAKLAELAAWDARGALAS